MSRCKCCDVHMSGNPGWIYLEDGTKIEEVLCSGCRTIAKNPDSLDTKTYALEELTEFMSLIAKDGVTWVRNSYD